MTVYVNGVAVELRAGLTLGALVEGRYPDRRWLAVAVNGEVVARSGWDAHVLAEGATVEVLTAVPGG